MTPPGGVTITFDETVEPFSHIQGTLVLCRFTADRPIAPRDSVADLRGVAIAPEIAAWTEFTLNGQRMPLDDRMIYTEIFTRNHLENLALIGGAVPPDGFRTFDPMTTRGTE